MYKDDEYIKRVNKTYSKLFSQRQTLPNYISIIFGDRPYFQILDYGAGKDAYGTIILRNKGFTDVTAYDIGNNYVEGLHDPLALMKTYTVIFASNVINIQTSHADITEIFNEVNLLMKNQYGYGYSEFYFNIPGKPRKCNLSYSVVIGLLNEVFGKGNSYLIYGDTESEIYKATRVDDLI